MEGYEYTMAERRVAKNFGGVQAGRDMRALIGSARDDNFGVTIRSINQFFD